MAMTGTSQQESRYLHNTEASPGIARMWASEAIRSWDCSDEVARAVAECVWLLSANVAQHVARVIGGSSRGYMVILQPKDDAIRIEVHDAGDDLRHIQNERTHSGLAIMRRMTSDWGCHRRRHLGKVVWCEVPRHRP